MTTTSKIYLYLVVDDPSFPERWIEPILLSTRSHSTTADDANTNWNSSLKTVLTQMKVLFNDKVTGTLAQFQPKIK
jgi:hypothetical protein